MTDKETEEYEAGYATALKDLERRLELLCKGERNDYYLLAYGRMKACLNSMRADLHLREIERRKARSG